MADIKISAMAAAENLTNAVVPIVQGGLNKKAAASLFGGGAEITDLTYAELTAAIATDELVAGALYRITDFATKHYIHNGEGDICLDGSLDPYINTGINEPLIVAATGVDTLSKEAYSELYPQDIIYYDWNPENWKYDVAFGAYDEAVLTGWKGTIYFRHDTINDVSMGHDFRQVKNRRWKRNDPVYAAGTTYASGDKVQVAADGVYVSMKDSNTGNAVSDAEWWTKIIDYNNTEYWAVEESKAADTADFIDVPCFYSQEVDPEDHYNREVKTVHFKPMKDDTSTLYLIATILQNNVFVLESDFDGHQVMGISAEILCVNNTFNGYQKINVLGAYFTNNTIGTSFNNNTIGTIFTNNTIGTIFTNNTIGARFNNNTIGAYFTNNTIGAYFSNNTIGTSFNDNTIGAYFSNNTIQNNIKYLITPNKTVSTQFRHNLIRDGVQGTSGTPLDFTSATHVFLNYNCEIYSRLDGTIRLKYMDNSDATVVVNYNA